MDVIYSSCYTREDGKRVFAYHYNGQDFHGVADSLKVAWQDANAQLRHYLTQLDDEPDTLTPAAADEAMQAEAAPRKLFKAEWDKRIAERRHAQETPTNDTGVTVDQPKPAPAKLSKPQQAIVDQMRQGAYIAFDWGRHGLYKDGKKIRTLTSVTVWAMRRKGITQDARKRDAVGRDYDELTDAYKEQS